MRRPVSAALTTVLLAGSGAVVGACGGGGEPEAADLPAPAARGLEVARRFNCTGCHTSDGSDSVGPTWKGLWGSEVELADGGTVLADEAYLRRSIEDPPAEVVEGFRSTMPQQELTGTQVDEVIAYIRELAD